MECLESKILKTEMFEFQCVNIESWKIEICMWNVWNLKFWELKCLIGMCEYLSWNLKYLCEAFGIWKFENWNVWYWKLKIEMSKYWKLKCLNTQKWKF